MFLILQRKQEKFHLPVNTALSAWGVVVCRNDYLHMQAAVILASDAE